MKHIFKVSILSIALLVLVFGALKFTGAGQQLSAALINTVSPSTSVQTVSTREMQTFLVSKGYLKSNQATGYMGAATKEALRKFYADNGLPTSGKYFESAVWTKNNSN